MDEQNWQKLMKRMDLADKIADVLICDAEDEDEDEEEAEAMEDAAAGAQGENDADAEIANLQKQLKQVEQERMIREEGARPAAEWKRKDFKYLLWYHKELQKLSTGEIRALFLIPAGIVAGVWYFKRGNVRDVRRRRGNGGKPLYDLAEALPDVYFEVNAPEQAEALSRAKEDKKLDAIWQKL